MVKILSASQEGGTRVQSQVIGGLQSSSAFERLVRGVEQGIPQIFRHAERLLLLLLADCGKRHWKTTQRAKQKAWLIVDGPLAGQASA